MTPIEDTAAAARVEPPILATVVAPAPSPWQFGLKTLLGLMVVCSVQFALMSYFTVFGGLVAAMVFCFVALAILLLWAVLFVRSRSTLMERLDFIGIRLVVGITVLLIGTVLAGGGTAVLYGVTELQTAMALESDIGIRTLRTEVWDSKGTRRALRIVMVVPGGNASKAGLAIGEVILVDGTVTQFYENLEKNRGGAFSINVTTSPVGGSIEGNPRRSVTIAVPP